MLTHSRIWAAIDALALRFDLSPSGLAKKAGLDPTSFNKSKRKTSDGKERWPSTESLSKVLQATQISFFDFAKIITAIDAPDKKTSQLGIIPSMAAVDNPHGFYENDKKPVLSNMPGTPLPGPGNEGHFILELESDDMEPYYRQGDKLILSAMVTVEAGDRAYICLKDDCSFIAVVEKLTTKKVEVCKLGRENDRQSFNLKDVSSISRILWISH
ncbi:MAG: helix-turn-helix transcriptional regulator [Methyloligellaceae bacterium]